MGGSGSSSSVVRISPMQEATGRGLRVDQHGALGLPTDAGAFGQRLSRARGRCRRRLSRSAPDAVISERERVELFEQDVVVIVAEGVAGDASPARGLRLPVVEAGDDDAARAGQDAGGIGAAFRFAREPRHLAGFALGGPLAIEIGAARGLGAGDAAWRRGPIRGRGI